MDFVAAAAVIGFCIVIGAFIFAKVTRGSHAHNAKLSGASGLVHTELEAGRIQERILAKEDLIERKMISLEERDHLLAQRSAQLDVLRSEVEQERTRIIAELERVTSLNAEQAKEAFLREVEAQAKHESARRIKRIEEETKQEAEARVRGILSVCMQRLAGSHAADSTVTVMSLETDEMKGRIIGREGRNIRTLERLTGVDFIIDETPNAVVLSSFDGMRREIARMTLERLLEDGRVHPARIEEVYYRSKSDIDKRIIELGEEAVLQADVHGVSPEILEILGRLSFRTSYGQNVLNHSIECSKLAALMAHELGADVKIARRAALLHDIGKAAGDEYEGPHALVGGQIARKYGETEEVAHAMEAHHNEVEPNSVEAVIVQTADALSGARPGARGESLENYVKRLRDLEAIANSKEGVDRVYAMQAGREIRVIIEPSLLDDSGAAALAREIAQEIQQKLDYPGQIKVTVIRESRAVDYAR